MKCVIYLTLLPITATTFGANKRLSQVNVESNWPFDMKLSGYELHHGKSNIVSDIDKVINLTKERSLGWVKLENNHFKIGGTYLHGIFNNGKWRRVWLNNIRDQKGLSCLSINIEDHLERVDKVIDILSDSFEKHIDIGKILIP